MVRNIAPVDTANTRISLLLNGLTIYNPDSYADIQIILDEKLASAVELHISVYNKLSFNTRIEKINIVAIVIDLTRSQDIISGTF